MIERKIVTGLITSTEFLQKIEYMWDPVFMESVAAKRMAMWCWTYYRTYNKAPGRDIEGIFFKKMKNGLDEDTAQEIQEEILPSLSEDFEKGEVDLTYLVDETLKYFNERKLEILSESVQALLENDKPEEARRLAEAYKPICASEKQYIDLGDRSTLKVVEEAFNDSNTPVVKFPKQLGAFWNEQLVKGSLIGILAPEKRGKTWILMLLGMFGTKQGAKVAMFQAGDMTEKQQIKRICINLAGKSDKEKYCGPMYEPVRDCIHQQTGSCTREDRQCDFGPFEGYDEKVIREDLTREDLIEAYKSHPDYEPCYNCPEYENHSWGVPWLKFRDMGINPLGVNEAKRVWRKFFIKYRRSFRLATYSNGTLTIKEMERQLDLWAKEDFEPGLILVDYAELLDDPTPEHRHKQNNIWKGFRRISQERDCCLAVPTQADAESYGVHTLSLKNFSEDKRKYSHCTAFYGLNQDPKGREKKIGLLRINELLLREGDFDINRSVTVLQNLKRGKPFIGSYF